MPFDLHEVFQTIEMVESENLDIRTLTMAISLRDTVSEDIDRMAQKVYDKIMRRAEKLVPTVAYLSAKYGVPIVNKRVSVTPIAIVAETTQADSYFKIAQALDRAAGELGIDYIAGYSALVHKDMTPGDRVLMDSIPEVLSSTKRVCSSINVGSTRAGINMEAIRVMGDIILETAHRTAHAGSIGCAKLVVFGNAVEDNPFIAGAMCGLGEGDCTINVGVSGPGVVLAAIKRLKAKSQGRFTFSDLAETIKAMAFKITRAGELAGREAVSIIGDGVKYGVIDLSLAPTPAIGDSIADILEEMGLERVGTHGTTAALMLLTDAVKKGGVMAASYVGGLSGAFIPVSEDQGMINATKAGTLTLDKLEAMTAICSVGMDMVAVPGDTSPETIAGIIADEVAVGVMNNKTTAVRIIPVIGKGIGETYNYGGLLGEAAIMPVHRESCAGFVNIKGRIAAPIHSLRN